MKRNKVRKFSDEEVSFIRERAYGLTRKELLELFNSRFSPITDVQLKNFLSRRRIHLGNFVYDEEQKQFIRDYYCEQKHSVMETVKEFQRLWPAMEMNFSKMNGILFYNGLKNGMAGRYNASQFKKGSVPHNTFKEGQTSKWGGLSMVKHNGVMKTVARAVWEEHHGEIPKWHSVINIDGNRENNDISNLALVDLRERGKLIHNKLTDDKETNSMIIARVKLENAIERKMKKDG